MKYKMIGSALLFIGLLGACVGQAPVRSDTFTKVRLPVGYIPNIQFAPLYVALEKGYYRAQGLDVTLDYSMETDAVALTGADTVQFAVVSGEQVLLGRTQNLPVVYVMDWFQKYPVGIVSMVDKNISKPVDLKGRKIGLPGLYGASYIGLRALLDAGGLTENDVTLDSIGYNQVEALGAGAEDAAVIYIANEPIQLATRGYKVNVFGVDDYLHLIGNGLITNEKTLKNNPDLVRRMVSATLKGLTDTIQDPVGAFNISKKYVENLDKSGMVQKMILDASINEWRSQHPGYSDSQSWNNMQDLLLRMGLLKSPLDLNRSFSNDFLPQ